MPTKNKRKNLTRERRLKAANRIPYASDLSDAEWKLIAPLFHKEKKD